MWKHDEIAAVKTGEGVTRRLLANSDELTLAEIAFDTGAVGARHAHPHEQASYVLCGQFRFTIGETDYDVKTGDSVRMAPNEPHGVVCIEAGKLLDVFTPARKDFL